MAGRLDSDSLLLLQDAIAVLEQGFADLPDNPAGAGDPEALRKVLIETATRLQDNYPYFHPQYAGQMLKPPHAVARLAYALATWINPNNHALDGGRASSAMEKEAVAASESRDVLTRLQVVPEAAPKPEAPANYAMPQADELSSDASGLAAPAPALFRRRVRWPERSARNGASGAARTSPKASRAISTPMRIAAR